MIRQIKTNAIAWLLFHANSGGKNFPFYEIKNKLVSKYGRMDGHDTQFIAGKSCYSCEGTGIWQGVWKTEYCYHCDGTGQYTNDRWVVLERYLVGDCDYVFHKPLYSTVIKTDLLVPNITGYVSHTKTKWHPYALAVLFLVYEKGYLKRFYRESGNGWRLQWWLPHNMPYNFVHFIKNGWKMYPLVRLKKKLMPVKRDPIFDVDSDKLPF